MADLDFGLYAQMDFGDLPDTYATTIGVDGARHVMTTTSPVYLGTAPDADGDGLDSPAATLDDTTATNDENGVARDLTYKWTPGATVSLLISVTGSNGYLVGWFDWNHDGVFGAGEQVTYGNVSAGNSQTWNILIPGTYVTGTMVNTRFRIYSTLSFPTSVSSAGLVVNGEVEDYQWEFDGVTAVTLANMTANTANDSVPIIAMLLSLLAVVAGAALWRLKTKRRSTVA